MALTTTSKIRAMSNITDSSVSDSDFSTITTEMTKEVMNKINTKVIREQVLFIDSTRENKINGTNTTYYVKNWKGKYLGDTNLDGVIDNSDITVIQEESDGTETELTVSSVTCDEGKFVLNSAPNSSVKLFVTYTYTHIDPDTPDPLLELAATYLAAAYGYLKRDAGISGTVRFGNVGISQNISASFGQYHKRYKELMDQILNYSNLKENWRKANVKI